jgi:hypothetical protein
MPRRRAQIPNYITVREEALGIPPSMPPVIIRWLWESADRLALADWHDGGLLVAGADEFIGPRAVAWAKIQADVLSVYSGPRALQEVCQAFSDGMSTPGPQAAVEALDLQLEGIRELVPSWVALDDVHYRRMKQEGAEKAKTKQEQQAAAPKL